MTNSVRNTGLAFGALLALSAVNVQAATFPTLDAGENTFLSYNEPGKFTDRWKFSLAQDSKVSVKITDIVLSLDGFGSTIKLLDNKKLKGTFDGFSFGEGEWATATLQAGVDYTFLVTGKATGWLGGAYKLDTNVAPVPVPAALGLFVAALVGMAGIRRRKMSAKLA
ncbi:MAG: VPLPA-CTERM sorting domain-containing protein [Hahellaceae bacterium]|nr:VPLPA-CTERM sorting domain-containing protein [Hahellaceae bacterium]